MSTKILCNTIRSKQKILSVPFLLIALLITGCAPYQSLKAPCDQYGNLCGPKIKINQW